LRHTFSIEISGSKHRLCLRADRWDSELQRAVLFGCLPCRDDSLSRIYRQTPAENVQRREDNFTERIALVRSGT
jgi:hypothetical protein